MSAGERGRHRYLFPRLLMGLLNFQLSHDMLIYLLHPLDLPAYRLLGSWKRERDLGSGYQHCSGLRVIQEQ